MPLYLIDLHQDTTVPFPGQDELAAWWIHQYGLDFSQLNVTGNDIVTVPARTVAVWTKRDGEYVRDYITKYEQYTRRFQVLDGDGRSIDIRNWSYATWHPVRKKPGRWYFPYNGSRPHWHRVKAPSGYRRLLEARSMTLDEDDLSRLTAAQAHAVLPHSKSDLERYVSSYDWYDDRVARSWKSSKCWKDQCRAARQYAKHKSRGKPVREYAPEDGWDLAARLSGELCPDVRAAS